MLRKLTRPKEDINDMQLFRTFSDWLSDLLWLVYPELCGACGRALNRGEKCLCTKCRLRLPKTNFHLEKENPVVKNFWGKVPVKAAGSYFYFTKGEKVQQLIFNFKYRGRKNIGVSIGEMYGYDLKKSQLFEKIDVIVPVPLHASKLRKRGYNQSEFFAMGLSKTMNIPVESKAVKRIINTDTQTRKHRYERFINMDKVFSIVNPDSLKGKHILLVDDVITTGSTLSACAESILAVPGTSVSIATIATA